jgi:circadian clock protein KaiC
MSAKPIASEKVATGIEGLDDILHGGFPHSRLHLVQGDPGAGKTTLGLQFLMEGARHGEVGLYVTLSETEEELRAVADSHGWSLDGISLHELSRSEERLSADEQNTFFHPSEVELNETVRPVLELVEKTKPRRVVFDSLSEMRLLAGDPLRYRRQVLALKQFFIGRHCTVLFMDDRTSAAGDLQLQSLAHGVISLEQLSPEYGGSRRRLRVIKMRGSQFRGGYHDFVIETGGLRVFPRLIASEHEREFSRSVLSSGIPQLDDLLNGGLDRGTSNLFIGPAGAGKSTLPPSSPWSRHLAAKKRRCSSSTRTSRHSSPAPTACRWVYPPRSRPAGSPCGV